MNLIKRAFWLAVFFAGCFLTATETRAASYLYALNDNASGNQIYGFSVDETTGGLFSLPGFPVNTGYLGGGSTNPEMIAIDRVNKRLYALNRGSNNISVYSINEADGSLSAFRFSPIAGIANERVVKVHPGGSPLIVGGDLIASYNVTVRGAFPAAGSPYSPGTNVSPAGATLSRDGNYFYTGGNLGNFYGGFAVDAGNGVLTALAGSPYDSGSQTPNPTATDLTGRLFVTNPRQALTRVYTTAAGVPTQVTNSPFANGLTSFLSDGDVHPNGRFFMLADRTGNRVGVYQINGDGAATTLSPISGSPFATGGTSSIALTFNRVGNFLYVANGTSRNITTFTVNNSTGALTNRDIQSVNTLGSAGLINGIAYINFTEEPRFDAPVDFNGDGKSDYVVTRSLGSTAQTNWFINYNGIGSGLSQTAQFGIGVGFSGGDVAVPEDFDGDGKDDIAVWRANQNSGLGYFYALRSGDNTFLSAQFGQAGDDPTVVGDFDGDNKADFAVFRSPTTAANEPCGAGAAWFYRPSSAPGVDFRSVCWGGGGDKVAPGDYDGDGKNDFAVFRIVEGAGVFFVKKSGGGEDTVYWGAAGDQTMPGDFDGDGKTDYVVARPNNPREFYVLTQSGSIQSYQFGAIGDVPAPGDYNGDGKADITVFHPDVNSGAGYFFVRPAQTGGEADFIFKWGLPSDYPAANYNFH